MQSSILLGSPLSSPEFFNNKLGILGGGQLALMLGQSAGRLGIETHIFCPDDNPPARHAAACVVKGAYTDKTALIDFAKNVDFVTYETENIPLEAVLWLQDVCLVRPDPLALKIMQDRLLEKSFLETSGISVAPYRFIDCESDLYEGLNILGMPCLLKTRRFGYDGKGQFLIQKNKDKSDIISKYNELAGFNKDGYILEKKINFTQEMSIVVVRYPSEDRNGNGYGNDDGELYFFYDITDTYHERSILIKTVTPSLLNEDIQEKARNIARNIVKKLPRYIGAMGIEMFYIKDETKNGSGATVLVNELSPRVHNSGHWTQDGCCVDQFESHVRAVCGLPVGSVARKEKSITMINLLGDEVKNAEKFLRSPNAAIHLYHKREILSGRKMGHVNISTSL